MLLQLGPFAIQAVVMRILVLAFVALSVFGCNSGPQAEIEPEKGPPPGVAKMGTGDSSKPATGPAVEKVQPDLSTDR